MLTEREPMHNDESSESDTTKGDDFRFPEWQEPLQELVLEFDLVRLHKKMQRVAALLRDRLQQMQDWAEAHTAEREALGDAISVFRVIKREDLDFADSR